MGLLNVDTKGVSVGSSLVVLVEEACVRVCDSGTFELVSDRLVKEELDVEEVMRLAGVEEVVEVIELDASWEVVLEGNSGIELEVAADSLGGP